MSSATKYDEWLGRFSADLVLQRDLPDETVESTLKSLWHTAAGNPCSAAHACGTGLETLSAEQMAELEVLIDRRLGGTPLMHLTSRAQFMGLELFFAPSVCLVRPETELLGQTAVDLLAKRPAGSSDPIMVDVGCGSGNLSCGIAHRIPHLRVYAIDVLSTCVELTKRNLRHCGLAERSLVLQGNLFAPLEGLAIEQNVDIVVCNPPYISTSRLKGDRAHLAAHEPMEALDGGPYGFAVHQRLIKEAPRFLRPGGCLAFEFGAGQWPQIRSLVARSKAFEEVSAVLDAHGVERVAVAQKHR